MTLKFRYERWKLLKHLRKFATVLAAMSQPKSLT